MNTKAIVSKMNSTVCIATGYGMDCLRFECRLGHEILSSPKPPKPALGPHPASYWMGTGGKATTHFPLLPRLRVRGAISLLPLYAFMAWTATTLPVVYLLCDTLTRSTTKAFLPPLM